MAKVFGALGYDVRLEYEKDDEIALLGVSRSGFGRPMPAIATDKMESSNHFRLFNLVAEGNAHRFVDPHETEPRLAGSQEMPDVRTRMELVSFNPGSFEINDYDGATLRLDIGQDSLSDSLLKPLFWSIAAGLDLAQAFQGKDNRAAAPHKYASDFKGAFGNRAIEIPGGLAELRFEVVLNKKKPWWRDIFSFLQSDPGDRLSSVFGFPGIAMEAIKIIDQAFDLLADDSKSLFKSQRMRFAMSGHAHQEFTMGMPGVKLGVVNSGFCLLAREQDYNLISEKKPQYLASYGRLMPHDWTLEEYLRNASKNPFDRIPYAVLRVKSEAASFSGNL